jgi:tocopherol cyclase
VSFWPHASRRAAQLTTGGGVRDLPLLGGTEDVALVGVHYKGTFIELVPWRGRVSWDIAPWGSWRISAASDTHEAEIVATCAPQDGTTLRAPTASGACNLLGCVCVARAGAA